MTDRECKRYLSDEMISFATKVFETNEAFIFETIRPFCEEKTHMTITKDKLIRALTLLREQEAVSTIVEQPLNDTRYIFCGACKAMLAQNKPKGYKYCPWCGRKVKWE